jgi:hypothetical protein
MMDDEAMALVTTAIASDLLWPCLRESDIV